MITTPYDQGGLKMVCVKSIVHALHVKWMKQLSLDIGLTWSRVIWPEIISKFSPDLIQGITYLPESVLANLDPFYAAIL